MKVCDKCGETPIRLILKDEKDAQEYDLCGDCRDKFYRFMKIPIEKPKEETTPWTKPETKKKPGRKKNG